MNEPQWPITCALCGEEFNVLVTHSHLRLRHGVDVAFYKSLGHEPANRAFYATKGAEHKGPNHPRWKGGKAKVTKVGYLRIWTPEGTRLQHRVVMEEKLGRPLLSSEHVHHKNGDKADNATTNLTLTANGTHAREHLMTQWAQGGVRRIKKELIIFQCEHCGLDIALQPSRAGLKNRKRFCSRACYFDHRFPGRELRK